VLNSSAKPRKLSEASKQKIRRRNLVRRIEKQAPLFKAEFLERDLAAKPNYFGIWVQIWVQLAVTDRTSTYIKGTVDAVKYQ
jgi:hypothetical protein